MKKKRTVERFRFPYQSDQMYSLLLSACKAEVLSRGRTFLDSPDFYWRIKEVADWLTSTDTVKFGLFICGNKGNGKTTLVKAMMSLYYFLHSNESVTDHQSMIFPRFGFKLVTARELVRSAKAFYNRTRDNREETEYYKSLMDTEVLCIDDLGTEPAECTSYGEVVNPTMEMLSYRYEMQFCTIATSNMAPDEIKNYYDERLADRFREMMQIINFSNSPSFR